MTFRKTVFWLHLLAGTIVGLVVLVMSVTGVLLAYEKQITAFADRGLRATPTPGGRLPVSDLVAKARAARPEATLAAITLRADPAAPAAFAMGREGVLYLDPYSGAVLGEGSKGIREFFHAVTDWHRWLGTEGESRAAGRAVTGASNLAFLFLVMSGPYLWLPRVWSVATVRAISWFQGGISGKARDFNWHNVIGLWTAIPLFLVVLSGAVISYPWASDLVYTLSGEEAPARRPPAGGERRAPKAAPMEGLDAAWALAEAQVAGWRSITLRFPTSPEAPLNLAIDAGNGGRPDLRSTLVADAKTGALVRHEAYESQSPGRQRRTWLRFIHTGEAAGVVGQSVAGVASGGAAVLVWTGLALTWRRFRAYLARRSRAAVRSTEGTPLAGGTGEPA